MAGVQHARVGGDSSPCLAIPVRGHALDAVSPTMLADFWVWLKSPCSAGVAPGRQVAGRPITLSLVGD